MASARPHKPSAPAKPARCPHCHNHYLARVHDRSDCFRWSVGYRCQINGWIYLHTNAEAPDGVHP